MCFGIVYCINIFKGYFLKKLIIFISLFLSINVHAWDGENLSVDFIDVKSLGHVSVYFTSPAQAPNPAGCSQIGTISWQGSNDSANNFLSTFLAAKMSGKQVQVIADGNTCLWGGWPKLLTVRVK